MPILQSYASGDGSINFVWTDLQGNALPDKPTMAEVFNHVYQEGSAETKYKGFRLVWHNHAPLLIPDVKRLSATTLEYMGVVYLSWNDKYYVKDDRKDSWERTFNLSLIAALNFFEANENLGFYKFAN